MKIMEYYLLLDCLNLPHQDSSMRQLLELYGYAPQHNTPQKLLPGLMPLPSAPRPLFMLLDC